MSHAAPDKIAVVHGVPFSKKISVLAVYFIQDTGKCYKTN
jgi:hypothetical protein